MEQDELLAIQELKSMTDEELNKVPYEVKFWICGVDNCCSKSEIRDYGIHPEYYWRRSNKDKWIDIMTEFRICSKHWRMYNQFWKDKTGKEPESMNCMWPVTKEELPYMIKSILNDKNNLCLK